MLLRDIIDTGFTLHCITTTIWQYTAQDNCTAGQLTVHNYHLTIYSTGQLYSWSTNSPQSIIVSWLHCKTPEQPSQPITWLISTELNITTSKQNKTETKQPFKKSAANMRTNWSRLNSQPGWWGIYTMTSTRWFRPDLQLTWPLRV